MKGVDINGVSDWSKKFACLVWRLCLVFVNRYNKCCKCLELVILHLSAVNDTETIYQLIRDGEHLMKCLIACLFLFVAMPVFAQPETHLNSDRPVANNNWQHQLGQDKFESDTRFFYRDDAIFSSFMRKFELEVGNVWHYPYAEDSKNTEEVGIKITFNMEGKIIKIQLLKSSGNKMLDEEVFRSLKVIRPIGGFPKGYNKDEFHMITFFGLAGPKSY